MGKLIRFPRRSKPRDERARPLFPPFRVTIGVGGSDARPSKFPSDAAPDEARSNQPIAPEIDRKRRRQRSWTIAALVFVFATGVAAALFGDRGYLDVKRQAAQRQAMQTAYDDHLKRVAKLKDDVDHLKSDPAAVERIAREKLGYVAPGEVTLLLPGDDPDDPSLDAKSDSANVPPASSTKSTH